MSTHTKSSYLLGTHTTQQETSFYLCGKPLICIDPVKTHVGVILTQTYKKALLRCATSLWLSQYFLILKHYRYSPHTVSEISPHTSKGFTLLTCNITTDMCCDLQPAMGWGGGHILIAENIYVRYCPPSI